MGSILPQRPSPHALARGPRDSPCSATWLSPKAPPGGDEVQDGWGGDATGATAMVFEIDGVEGLSAGDGNEMEERRGQLIGRTLAQLPMEDDVEYPRWTKNTSSTSTYQHCVSLTSSHHGHRQSIANSTRDTSRHPQQRPQTNPASSQLATLFLSHWVSMQGRAGMTFCHKGVGDRSLDFPDRGGGNETGGGVRVWLHDRLEAGRGGGHDTAVNYAVQRYERLVLGGK